MPDLRLLAAAEARRWSAMHVDPSLKPAITAVARRLTAPVAKAAYKSIEAVTHVPWFVIAVIHEREASQNWNANIAQGDRFNRRSTHVPKNRGPFPTFEAAAVDALTNCAPFAAKWHDWSTGGTLLLLEEYNGLGYANKGRPSPYDWAASDQYVSGKFVRDGVYDPSAVDHQLGCAALLACMAELDHDVHFDGETAPTPAQPLIPAVPASIPAKPLILAVPAPKAPQVATVEPQGSPLVHSNASEGTPLAVPTAPPEAHHTSWFSLLAEALTHKKA